MAYNYQMQSGDTIITVFNKIQEAVNQGHCLSYMSNGTFVGDASTRYLGFSSNLGAVKIFFPTPDASPIHTYSAISKLSLTDFFNLLPSYSFLSSVTPFTVGETNDGYNYYYRYVPIQSFLNLILSDSRIVSNTVMSDVYRRFRSIFFDTSDLPAIYAPISYIQAIFNTVPGSHVVFSGSFIGSNFFKFIIHAFYNQAGTYTVDFIKFNTQLSLNFIKGDKGDPGPAGGVGTIDLSPLVDKLTLISDKLISIDSNLSAVASTASTTVDVIGVNV